MKFIDEVQINVSAGSGGDGVVSWRREKYVPRGGPDGGNGGNGGAVILVSDSGLNTLIDFSFNPHLRAESGGRGGSQQATGRDGKNCSRKVPVGTQVFFRDKLVADLRTPGARWIAARGGVGGKGNAFFKNSSQQAPDFATPGSLGERHTLRLVLKSVADIGLIGLPNVGKSTLISSISASRPEVADYPFTTRQPSLGVVMFEDERRIVVADIPGLIPGAHKGKGLGTTFLRHIERTSCLAQLIDISTDPAFVRDMQKAEGQPPNSDALLSMAKAQFQAIDDELRLFSPALSELPRAVLFSKADLAISRAAFEISRSYFESLGFYTYLFSSHTNEGIAELKEGLYSLMGTVEKFG